MAAASALGFASVVACDTPPQIVEISPDRNALQVPSNATVSIRFDRPVDETSVAAHFSIRPLVAGTIRWPSRSEMVFTHTPFRALTAYTVRLGGGYRDANGHANQLAHGWRFTTESPPVMTGSSPGAHDQNIDPASYISLQFSREMDLQSLQAATSISPYLPITVRRDPGDARRAIVAPLTLLDAGASYSLTVTPDARDVDGNPLQSGVSLDFGTGSIKPLRHWVTFIAVQGPASAGIWVVDENRVPRQVAAVDAQTFAWSPDGTHLLARTPSGAWSDVTVGGGRALLPFQATWADYLAPGLGFAYLDHGALAVLPPTGPPITVDRGVTDVAVSPDGRSLAYVAGAAGAHGPGGTEIRGFTVELRSRYRIAAEGDAVDALAWSPDGSRLSYRVATADAAQSHVRVKTLLGAGEVVTVAIGEVDAPRWQADSRHLLFSATVNVAGSPLSRAFRVSVSDAAGRPLGVDQSIPAPLDLAVREPQPSPDGHQLAFLQPTSGGDQVWVMNVDGTGFAPLTGFDPVSFPYSCLAPAWTKA